MAKHDIKKLTPQTHEQIASRVRAQLAACTKSLRDTKELGLQLAASKIVVATLQAQAEEMKLDPVVVSMGDAMAQDLSTTIECLDMARDLKRKGL